MATNTLGLMVDVSVTRTNVHVTIGGLKALEKFAKRQKVKTVKEVYPDKDYQGPNFSGWVKKKVGAVVRIGKNLTKTIKEFVPAKKRWGGTSFRGGLENLHRTISGISA